MSDNPDYIRVTAGPPPEPPAHVRVIRSEMISSMPIKDLTIWLGQPPTSNPLLRSISVGVTHA
jgi:hypothetical protein